MALLVDTVILLLLAGTLGYAFLVDRRVRALMAALRGLEPVIGQFSAAVDRTESSIKHMQADTALRSGAKRGDEPRLTRPASAQSTTAPQNVARAPQTQPAQPLAQAVTDLPPGMARVTGKADLVRGFFETVRSRGA